MALTMATSQTHATETMPTSIKGSNGTNLLAIWIRPVTPPPHTPSHSHTVTLYSMLLIIIIPIHTQRNQYTISSEWHEEMRGEMFGEWLLGRLLFQTVIHWCRVFRWDKISNFNKKMNVTSTHK